MRRLIWIAATVLVLVGAGIAVAHDNNGKSIKLVSAGFTATTASNVRTDTCTATDGTYTTTHGRWTGTATGDLSGNATIDAEILVTPTLDGTVSGKLRIDGTDHTTTVAQFDAVIDAKGNLAGLAEGHGSADWNKLIANLSANWSATAGFTGGKLGGGTTGGNAVEISSGGCRPAKPAKPETIELKGAVTIGTGTVTVAGVVCTVPSTLTTDVAKLSNGDHVDLTCTVSGGTNTLSHVEGDHHH
jgi:hypothetical protein